MLQAARYRADLCQQIDRPELARDPRFDGAEKLAANASEAVAILRDVFAARTLAERTARTREGTAFELVASPVQFDERPTPTSRAPEFNEHGDEIPRELGLDPERILELKASGAVA